jgi:uncharacterized UPF0160 family protein
MEIKTIATHNGKFHPDETMAVAILRMIFPKVKVVRTRDTEKLKEVDLRVDVGRKYNSSTNDFDHHQNDFTEKRPNGIPYASAGLIWKHFGKKLVKSEVAWNYVDESLIQVVDAQDSGFDLFKESKIRPYTLTEVITSFSPLWNENDQDYDSAFLRAVDFCVSLLNREIKISNSINDAETLIRKEVNKTKKSYLVIEKIPSQWRDILIKYPKIIYVIYKNPDGKWYSEAARTRMNSFEIKKPFPLEWADLTNEKLAAVTGVKDSFFAIKQDLL